MQVHTFIADSATEAVEQIRAELGPSAVVLSVRKLPRNGLERFLKQEQIEVLAGVEEPLIPIAKAKTASAKEYLPSANDPLSELREELRQLRQQINLSREPRTAMAPAVERTSSSMAHILNQTGLLPAFSEQIVQEMAEPGNLPISEQISRASELLRKRWIGEPATSAASVHVFIGVPGSGKSTVLCKMLAQTSLVERQPATVFQLDSHVANPSSQPAVYAEIVGAQFERTAPLHFERREESVYVDLPGVALSNAKALGHLKKLISDFGVPEVHLVLNAAYEASHLLDQVRFFSPLGLTDLIVSHLDEETRWGKLWNLVLGTNYSVRSLSCGQNIPGDFHRADPDLILKRQFRGK